MPVYTLSHEAAKRRGFPSPAVARQVDYAGMRWEWVPPERAGLGELGFWQALIGLATGVMGMFGGGGKKAQQALDAKQQELDATKARVQELEVAAASWPKPKSVWVYGVFAVAILMVWKGR